MHWVCKYIRFYIYIYIYPNRPGYNSNGSFEHVLTWLSTAFIGGFHTVEETERVPSRSKSHMENLGRTWRSKAETTKPVAPSMKILRSVFKESKTMATMALSTYIIVCHRGCPKNNSPGISMVRFLDGSFADDLPARTLPGIRRSIPEWPTIQRRHGPQSRETQTLMDF